MDAMKDEQQECYALTLYTYDYYERDVLAVSFSPEKLTEEYARWQLDNRHYCEKPLLSVEEHEDAHRRQKSHWVIRKIKFL